MVYGFHAGGAAVRKPIERLAHHPTVDRGHDVVALGGRYEFRRRHQRPDSSRSRSSSSKCSRS